MTGRRKATSRAFALFGSIKLLFSRSRATGTADGEDICRTSEKQPLPSEAKPPRHWLYEEGPEEGPAEDDDFEGDRNWAVILVLAALALLPIAGLIMLLL